MIRLYIKTKILRLARRFNRRRAIDGLKRHPKLWEEVNNYMIKTKSTGVSWSDFYELYCAVRRLKPKNILELGPGASTIVMGMALMENEKEGFPGKITAMEELDFYLKMSQELLPDFLKNYVEYCLSTRVDYCYEIYRGVRYENVPERDYDFIFVDGPEHTSPTDSQFTFDADLIYQLQRSKVKISAIVDYRLSSSYVFQKLLGRENVRFNLINELCFINDVSKEDLRSLNLEVNTQSIIKSGKLLGNSKINMYE